MLLTYLKLTSLPEQSSYLYRLLFLFLTEIISHHTHTHAYMLCTKKTTTTTIKFFERQQSDFVLHFRKISALPVQRMAHKFRIQFKFIIYTIKHVLYAPNSNVMHMRGGVEVHKFYFPNICIFNYLPVDRIWNPLMGGILLLNKIQFLPACLSCYHNWIAIIAIVAPHT